MGKGVTWIDMDGLNRNKKDNREHRTDSNARPGALLETGVVGERVAMEWRKTEMVLKLLFTLTN